MTQASNRQQLRRQLRARRRALTERQQARAAQQLARLLAGQSWFRRARHIGFYWPNDGEIDPRPLLALALHQGKHCYLPVLVAGKRLVFRRLLAGSALAPNRFGIPEPARGATVRQPWLMDLVLLPLVGFDATGNRLGMGGGFYDRSFATHPQRPRPSARLVGLAHSCQQVARLEAAGWDVPLHAIATEQALVTPRRP